MIKNKKIKKFLILFFISIILITIITFTINKLKINYRHFYKMGEELILEQSYNTIFNEFDINTKMSDIYIKESIDNTIKVMVYGEDDYITLTEKNNKLFIDVKEKNLIHFNFYKYISKIELYIPKNYSNLIRIDSAYGNVNIDEFSNASFVVNMEYGDIDVTNTKFISVDNEYGNIKLDQANKARVNALSGNVEIKEVNDIEIENEYGDIYIEKVLQHLKLNNDSGDIKIKNLVLSKDSSIKAEYGDIEIGDTNEIYIDVETDFGKINIKKNYKKSDIVLKIYNQSGDINIDN